MADGSFHIHIGDLDFFLIGFLQVQRERVQSFPAEKLHRQGVTSCKKREGKEKAL